MHISDSNLKNAAEPITRQWHDILSNDAEHGIDAIFSCYYRAPKNLCFAITGKNNAKRD
jgi:hypothetical protein